MDIAFLREGLTASFCITCAWVLVTMGTFVPFIAACLDSSLDHRLSRHAHTN
jgi:hypothetical protein